MENVWPSLEAKNRQTIVEGLNKLDAVSNCEANQSENECDDDVILIEHEIPVIDLCTPERRSRIPFADLYDQDFGRNLSVEHGNFFDRMRQTHTESASKSQIKSRSACERSVNHEGETLGEFFDRMRQTHTENASNSENRPQSVRSVNHGGETLGEFFDRMRQTYTENASNSANRPQSVRSVNHGGETLGEFFDRMRRTYTENASKSPNSPQTVRSVNHGGETLGEFFDRMRQTYTENASNSANRPQTVRSVNHGGERLGEFFDRMKQTLAENASKSPNRPQTVRSVNHGEETLGEFFNRMKKKEITSKLPTNKTSIVYNASENTPVMCIICLRSAIGRQPQATFCGHVFCKVCIERAMTVKKECPTCKRPMACVNPLYI